LGNILRAWSGTIWNAETYTKRIQTFYPSDATAKTVKLLWQKAPSAVMAVKDKLSLRARLEEIYHVKALPQGSFIDSAGIFRDIADPAEIAKEILSLPGWEGTPVKGVAYYNTADQLMVMRFVNGILISEEITKSALSKEEMVVFWGQKYTT